MQFRSSFSFAVLTGALLGSTVVGLNSPKLNHSIAAITPAAPLASPALTAAEIAPVRWDLPVVWNQSVERFVTLFHEKQSDRMALYLKRSGRYEGMIREKLRERGMPQDLLYLSMIESGFNPTARSKAQAVGLWQFIAETGRRYDLRIDGYVDERRDPDKATDAALRYLSDLHGQFGSWNLAAAAYNTGENRVARIMREETGSARGEEADFWKIRSRLPSETREYIPLMYAAAIVAKQPEKYGLADVPRWMPASTDTVQVPGGVSLKVVARAVEVDAKEIVALNPQLLREMTPPGDAYPVRIPDGKSALFAASFDSAREAAKSELKLAEAKKAEAKKAAAKKVAKTARHKVRRGESLSTIAKRHGVTVKAIQRTNGMGKKTGIRAGQVLRIPRSAR